MRRHARPAPVAAVHRATALTGLPFTVSTPDERTARVEVIGVGLLIALVWKIVDFARMAVGGDRSGVVTQALAWVVSTAVAFLAANADLTEGLPVYGDRPLGTLNAWSIILAGLLIGSGASATVDVKQAIDGNDSARKPPLAVQPAGRYD